MSVSLPVIRDDHVNQDLCGPCGGKCCSYHPGAAFPEDFGSTEEEIAENLYLALKSGRWAIDWWEGDPKGGDRIESLYIRPAVKGREGQLRHPAGSGPFLTRLLDSGYPCTFHTESGCEIFETRPTGCRGLKPGKDSCEVEYGSKKDSCLAWYSMQELIEDVKYKVYKERCHGKKHETTTQVYQELRATLDQYGRVKEIFGRHS